MRAHRFVLALPLLTFLMGAGAPPSEEPPRLPPQRTVDGRRLLLLGSTMRKIGDVPALWGFYVDETDARRSFPPLAARAGGRDHAHLIAGDHATTFVTWGQFTKLLHIKVTAPVAPSALQPWLKEVLAHELSDKSAGEVQKAAAATVALFDSTTALAADDTILLRTTPDGNIAVEIAGQLTEGPQNPKVVRALWNGIFGNSGAADLKHGLLDTIERLAR